MDKQAKNYIGVYDKNTYKKIEGELEKISSMSDELIVDELMGLSYFYRYALILCSNANKSNFTDKLVQSNEIVENIKDDEFRSSVEKGTYKEYLEEMSFDDRFNLYRRFGLDDDSIEKKTISDSLDKEVSKVLRKTYNSYSENTSVMEKMKNIKINGI